MRNNYTIDVDGFRTTIHVVQKDGTKHSVRILTTCIPKLRYCSVCIVKSGTKLYARVSRAGYKALLHRHLLGIEQGIEGDHEDGNGLNCCLDNIRLATRLENAQNIGLTQLNSSGVRGVHWSEHAGKWEARVQVNGINTYLGLYTDLHEAAHAVFEFKKLNAPFSKEAKNESYKPDTEGSGKDQ